MTRMDSNVQSFKLDPISDRGDSCLIGETGSLGKWHRLTGRKQFNLENIEEK